MTLVSFKVLLVVALLQPVFLFSQDIHLSITKNEIVTDEIKVQNVNSIKRTKYGDNQITLVSESFNSDFTLWISNDLNKSHTKIKLTKHKKNKLFYSQRISSITLVKNKLVVLGNNHFFILNLNTDLKTLTIKDVFENSQNYNYSAMLNENEVFVNVKYDFHPLDAKNKHVWGIIDLNTNKIKTEKIMPNDDVVFSYFVNKWFDVSNNKIAYSHSSKYQIEIFNNKFELIDSIKTSELDSNNYFLTDFEKVNVNSKDQISKLKSIDDNHLTRIRKIYFLNDSTIAVILKLKASTDLRLDIWIKSSGTWQKKGQKTFEIWYEENNAYKPEDLKTLTDFYQNVNDLIYNGNNNFELWYYPFIPNVETEKFNVQNDYYDKQNNAILEKKNFIGVKNISIDKY